MNMKAVKARCPHCGPMYAYTEVDDAGRTRFVTNDEWLKLNANADEISEDGLGLELCEHADNLQFVAVDAARCTGWAWAVPNRWDGVIEHAAECDM